MSASTDLSKPRPSVPVRRVFRAASGWTGSALCALALSLTACGGGGSSEGVVSTPPAVTPEATVPATVLASVQVAIPPSPYASDTPEHGGWVVLQTARALCGFGTPAHNARLDAAAEAHAGYLLQESASTGQSLLSHYEDNTANPFYTGYEPWDRTAYQGYGVRVAEILEATTWTYDGARPPALPAAVDRGATSMRNLLNTVYHLSGAMMPGVDVGFGAAIRTIPAGGTQVREEYRFGSLNGYQTQTFALGVGQVATYPCAGSANIPTAFVPAQEAPNPFPSLTSTSQKVGPPIYVKADAGQTLRLTSASLTSAGGQSVALVQLNAGNDPAGKIAAQELFVVPAQPLQANTEYSVQLNGTLVRNFNTLTWSRAFRFTTGAS